MKIDNERLLKNTIVLWITVLLPSGSESFPGLSETQHEVGSQSTLLKNNGSSDEYRNGTLIQDEEEDLNDVMATTNITTTEPYTTTPAGEIPHVNSGNVQLKATPCEETKDCRNIDGSYCNRQTGLCDCRSDHPITDSLDCFRESKIGEFCHYDVQCVRQDSQSRCDSTLHICQCQPRFVVKGRSPSKKGGCVENDKDLKTKIGSYVDPALFGIMGALALMFIIICVVLQLFSRAQFRENRTIFNTPNPRLMNVSLMKDSKLFAQDSKRKSTKYRNSIVRTQSSDRSPESMESEELNQGRSMEGRQTNANGGEQKETARVTVESSA